MSTTPEPGSPHGPAQTAGQPVTGPRFRPLDHRQRRVLGVLIEKAKTTPETYPLTANALVSGCNQKSNRDPLVTFDQDDVIDVCADLQKIGAVSEIVGNGRVAKFRHHGYDWFGVDVREISILAELLLRGPQTIGDLRQRAGRMEPLGTFEDVTALVRGLVDRRLMVELSPPGRGQVVTHNLYPADELARVKARHGSERSAEADEDRPPARPAAPTSPGPFPAPGPSAAATSPSDTQRGVGAHPTGSDRPGVYGRPVPAGPAPPAQVASEGAIAQLRQTIDALRETIEELRETVRDLRDRLETVENLVR